MSVCDADAMSLAGSEWGVKYNKRLFIQFSGEGKLHGNGGCNNFFGSYELKGDRLIVSPLGATKKMCPPDAMKHENSFFEVLQSELIWKRDGHKLELFGIDRKLLLKLQQRDWD